jgi:outer membrane protein
VNRRRPSIYVLAFCALAASPASAQIDLRTAEQKAAPQTWNVTIGARVGVQPSFPGAKSGGFGASPVFSIGRGLGSRWLSMADDGISIGLVEGDAWRAGATGKLLWQRRERDDAALRGLGDARFGGEAGAFVEIYPLSWLRARAELRRGFLAHDAPMGDLKLDAFARVGERWIVAAGPRLSLAGGDHQRTYFGVDARQSAASGLPVFRPEGGVLSYGVAAQVTYQWTARLETTAYASANRLAGDAARSPLVTQRASRDQFGAGVSTRWTFDTGF